MSPDQCKLMRANNVEGVVCADKDCVFWRSSDRLGMLEERPGCAIQYFNLITGDRELASWLLDVKKRLEADDLSSSG